MFFCAVPGVVAVSSITLSTVVIDEILFYFVGVIESINREKCLCVYNDLLYIGE